MCTGFFFEHVQTEVMALEYRVVLSLVMVWVEFHVVLKSAIVIALFM